MKYMLLIHMNTEIWDTLSEADRQEVFQGHTDFIDLITKSGELLSTEPLCAPSHTTTVRIRNNTPAITDGPYLETKEYFCGYYLIDCDTKPRALALATMIPDAKYTAIEVRPLMTPTAPAL
ncbi:YciI family protein [Sphaerisporangium aureirubrum]|uniref:YciI family protein n=1 Tax=Sphaerisporangium aureirubrum TaxID=1544736 RepID=A0ABW1NNC7_9ACTN